MSETTTQSIPETSYEAWGEATENDNRDDLAGQFAQDGEAPAEPAPAAPQEPVEAAEEAAAPEAHEDTEDEPTARAARLARDLREQRRRARQLEQENAALRGQRPAETRDESIEREIAQRAAAMAQQEALAAKCNEIYQHGVAEYGRTEFDESVKAVNETFGAQMMPVVLDTITEVEKPEKLLQWLADNPDRADALAALPPHRLGAALAREAAKLAAPKVKAVSKAPPPIKPIPQRSTDEPETDMEKMSMEQLAALWDKRDWERRFR